MLTLTTYLNCFSLKHCGVFYPQNENIIIDNNIRFLLRQLDPMSQLLLIGTFLTHIFYYSCLYLNAKKATKHVFNVTTAHVHLKHMLLTTRILQNTFTFNANTNVPLQFAIMMACFKLDNMLKYVQLYISNNKGHFSFWAENEYQIKWMRQPHSLHPFVFDW